ncbi:lycopene cyclase domain-containing protein [Nocardioides perillae]|uniref:Lycopene cyclase domain-containing protein n=1 Tax=Nocardioides perillae TaxID=1119534 RepID=A0A7Y9RQU3_9ACTN|nr:lycopene cyclase domain-containing protein [Nocardioides perillae]
MEQYEYLVVMGLCLLVTLPLELLLGARVWRRPRRLLLTLLPVVAVYSVWDVVSIQRGLWDYSERFTTGILLPLDMPLEELVFFVVVPICGLLTLEAVGNVLAWLRLLRAGEGLRAATATAYADGVGRWVRPAPARQEVA